MADFYDMQREALREEGFSEEDFRQEVRKLKILRFDLDTRKENIVSSIDRTIVFVSGSYMGEKVNAGDIWICSVVYKVTVYEAMPLKKLSSTFFMGLSDEMREGIVDALYETHKREFAKIFEQRYRESVYSKAFADANQKNEEIVAALKSRIDEMQMQLEKSRMLFDSQRSSGEDEMELSSEEVSDGEVVLSSEEVPQVPVQQPQAPVRSPCMCSSNFVSPAPGMPEMRVTDQQAYVQAPSRYTVVRTSEETLFCPSFDDGKYFVHINPSMKFLVVKKHDFGSAVCIDHKIRLDGLADYVAYSGRAELMAETSRRYDGIIVYF